MRPFSSLVALFLLVPTALRAAHVLQYESREELTSFVTHETTNYVGHHTVLAGADRCRLDEGSVSYILRSDLRKFWVVFHWNKTYWELKVPVRLEDEVAEGSRGALEEASRFTASLVEVTPTDEVGEIGNRQVELWRAAVQHPVFGRARDLEIWLATDLDLPSYRELSRNVVALNVVDREWYGEILALEGLTVKYEEKSRSKTKSEVITRTLVSLREEDLDNESFEIPEGYERKELPLEAVFSIQAPREIPARRVP